MDEPVAIGEQPPAPARQTLRRALRSRAAPFALGIIATLALLLLYNALTPRPAPVTLRDVNAAVAAAVASVTPAPAYSAQVYQVIRPSLVLIQSQARGAAHGETSLGSGVVINDKGYVLTSLHVVTDAAQIQLTFADGTESPAEVIAMQPENDIAVLAAEQLPEVLVPATLGNPDAMRVGDEVYAVGNPFGLYSSMSAGVISGFNRTFQVPDSDRRLEGLIQFDAAVNPGNSGGPLLNRGGQVIAIVTGIANPVDEEFFVGIGFAVPIDTAGGAAGLPRH